MARLPDAPRDTARIIPWAQEFKGAVERDIEDLTRNKIGYPQGVNYLDKRTVALVTATGTSQASASLIAADLNELTSGTLGTAAAILTGARPGRQIFAANVGTATLGLYPGFGDRIGTAGTNASVALSPAASIQFNCITAARWQILRGA